VQILTTVPLLLYFRNDARKGHSALECQQEVTCDIFNGDIVDDPE